MFIHTNTIKHEVNAHVQNNMTSVSGGLFLVAAAAIIQYSTYMSNWESSIKSQQKQKKNSVTYTYRMV